ncbi:hypothetical protein M885DRAFT_514955 [Pelagophyceae sp. CCMP2097]|nr:hypothetical protein M885DRAFT_514955 [Pelagophyceae sp. CCMP2097]|mmetsp:Transcript_7004/g.22742  ORF Transcript_7004/g.22742 Transcript_7004/m.22742 type:complete len:173 (-) Transcript_7004:171-689(-)
MAEAGPRRWRYNLAQHSKELPKPVGYVSPDQVVESSDAAVVNSKARSKTDMMQKRAMDMALAPGKNIFMQGFMMWMSGSGINIFSIMITGSALVNPLKEIAAVETRFKRFSSEPGLDLTIPKLVFILCNCGMIAVALWKCNTMGLLPITAADWTSFLVTKEMMEVGGNTIAL